MATTTPPATVASSIHRIQLSLLSTAACTDHQLLAAASLLSQPDYSDVVHERSIAALCGYPRCPNPLPLPHPHPSPRFRIALREHRVYDLHDTYNYCSQDCLVASRALSATLPAERLAAVVSDKLDWVLELFGGHGDAENLGKKGGLSLGPNLAIKEKSDPGPGEVSFDQWVELGVDGYVSQRNLKQGSEFSIDNNNDNDNDNGGHEGDFTSTVIIGDGVDAVNVSEQLAKQLEDVIISEKKTRKSRVRSIAPKHKSTLNSSTSSSNTTASSASSFSMQDHPKQLGRESEDGHRSDKKKKPGRIPARKESEDAGQSGKKSESKKAAMKSSLKTSVSSNVGRQSVKWADQRTNEPLEEKMEGLQISESSGGDDNSLRLASAAACADALIQAADAVALGGSEAGKAVSDAGLVILPQPQYGDNGDPEADEDMFDLDKGVVKWPNKPVLLDTDMFDVEDSWHDAPPEGFNVALSSFATMWMSLFGWITCSSLAYIYGHDESSHEEFLFVNGVEYPRKIVLGDGKSQEIRQTLDSFISRALPRLVMDLRLSTPVSTLEKAMGRLFGTMTFIDALPSLRARQWHVIVLLFIDALSVHRLPALAPHMTNRDMLQHTVLNAAQISGEEYEYLRGLLLPCGRLPHLSMQCGG